MSKSQVDAVDTYTAAVHNLMRAARLAKPAQTIEPPLTYADLSVEIKEVLLGSDNDAPTIGQAQYAAIETAFRNVFYHLIATTSLDDPAFSEIWNLLDIVLIFSDQEWCEPALVFWLAEETLESQTIDGCQRVFDYLDSRRERMIAKHWKSKYLVVLRACTDLLRRLSRAEDTVFCGRVFIYLFQSFPLGDKSAVNLRGEYHVENVTAFDARPAPPAAGSPTAMELDPTEGGDTINSSGQAPPPTVTTAADGAETDDKKAAEQVGPKTGEGKSVEAKRGDTPAPGKMLSTDELYPIFWSLQESFVKPTTLFDPVNLKAFKAGLEVTLAKFKEVQREQDARSGSGKIHDEAVAARAGVKRKRDDGNANGAGASSYNPKYLTNRDLFELEISDLSFRRHVLVQALVLAEFLLGQTPKAKARLASLKNKSVIYEFTLDEGDAEWVRRVKAEIAGYLQAGAEGKFYYRMVDTVLARDKNWVHWKAESCPPFQRPPVAPATFDEVRAGAQRATTSKRLRAAPMSALDLGFLSEHDASAGLAKLRDPARRETPALAEFERPIADYEFDASMATDPAEKERASDARASKLWRALRVAAKSRLAAFEPLDDGANVQALFATPEEAAAAAADAGEAAGPGEDGARTADAGPKTNGTQGPVASVEGIDGSHAQEPAAAEGAGDAEVAVEHPAVTSEGVAT